MRKFLIGIVVITSLFVLVPPAHAVEIIDRDTGYGYAEISGWSRGYGTVAIVARYNGRADMFFRVRCSNGQTFRRSWTDGGPMFRFTLNVPRNARCKYLGQIDTNGYVALILGVF
jgi:hypothetical protein